MGAWHKNLMKRLMPTKKYRIEMHVVFNETTVYVFPVTVDAKSKRHAQKKAERDLCLKAGDTMIDRTK